MLVHASCKPTEQAVNTFCPFLSLFFNVLLFSAVLLCLSSTDSHSHGRAQPARAGQVQPHMTHGVQQVLITRLTGALWLAPQLQHFIIVNFLSSSSSWKKPFLYICRIYSLRWPMCKHMYLYIPPSSNFKRIMFLHPLDQRQKLSHLCDILWRCRYLTYFVKNLFSAPYLMGTYSINETSFYSLSHGACVLACSSASCLGWACAAGTLWTCLWSIFRSSQLETGQAPLLLSPEAVSGLCCNPWLCCHTQTCGTGLWVREHTGSLLLGRQRQSW